VYAGRKRRVGQPFRPNPVAVVRACHANPTEGRGSRAFASARSSRGFARSGLRPCHSYPVHAWSDVMHASPTSHHCLLAFPHGSRRSRPHSRFVLSRCQRHPILIPSRIPRSAPKARGGRQRRSRHTAKNSLATPREHCLNACRRLPNGINGRMLHQISHGTVIFVYMMSLASSSFFIANRGIIFVAGNSLTSRVLGV
jgi:hypothetical protein